MVDYCDITNRVVSRHLHIIISTHSGARRHVGACRLMAPSTSLRQFRWVSRHRSGRFVPRRNRPGR